MKFAHLADCHIGAWRDPKLKQASLMSFFKAIDKCIYEKVDFVLISGDLFNTAIPSIESLKGAVHKLKELKDKNIPVYVIAGSHDFSPSGKTMLDILEKTSLIINVAKGNIEENKLKLNFTIDEKTGAKITGMIGKRGGLEKNYYEDLKKNNLEEESGYKIFMFHSALTEFKPEDMENMDSHPLSLLPKNFDYYAGGHVHYIFDKQEENYGLIAFPGPLFPNNFKELEKLKQGSFNIVETEEKNTKIRKEKILVHNVYSLSIDCENKTPEKIESEINNEIKDKEFNNTIVTIRLYGKLDSGRPTDIKLKEIFEKLYDKSAYFVMKNTQKLSSKEFEDILIEQGSSEDIEEKMIAEQAGKFDIQNMDKEKEKSFTKKMMYILNQEKQDGEKVYDFEDRIKQEIKKQLGI